LIEWRRMSDAEVDERLLRVSVGVESWEDLKGDLLGAFESLGNDQKNVTDRTSNGGEVQLGQEGAQMPEAGAGAV
jgi:cystathionine gamma-synthase